MQNLIVFARIGWMVWYRGPQPGDEKPIGGGSYNKTSLGHEAFNFLPLDGYMLGYFQPRLSPNYPSTVALERIEAGSAGKTELKNILVVFVATDPKRGSQRIVGWYRDATVYRQGQTSKDRRRHSFSYYLRAAATREAAVLIPAGRRDFIIPRGKGAFGQANVCYALDTNGQAKNLAWMDEAFEYIDGYNRENIWEEPESEADPDIEQFLETTIERAAGFQSNPRIRRAVEDYAMKWAEKRLNELGYAPEDKHKNKPYDFLCKVSGKDLYVEVKGTQDDGRTVSLSPNEVEHAQKNKNSALFIVHSVKVKGKRRPVVSGGEELMLNPWEISTGKLKPRGYAFTHGACQHGFPKG